MKITLFSLNGSFSHSNLAIRRLRPPLEAAEFEVSLLEAGLRDGDADVLASLVESGSDIYGFSCYIWNISRMLTLAHDLSSLKPNALIVFGGPEVSYGVERFNGHTFIDCIIKRAGETAMVDVCSAYREKRAFPRIVEGGKMSLSSGIMYRPDEPSSRTLYYESTVGCPFSCAFCLSSVSGEVSAKSSEQVLSELLEFEKLEGDRIIKFVDRTFNFNKKRASQIWKGLLSEKYTKRYQFEICAPLLDEEAFDILSRFDKGKIQLEAGLQSTDPKTLAAVSRHLDAKSTLSACRRVLAHKNVHLHLDLIAGLPYETYEGFSRSFDDAYFCCDQLQLGFLKLLHGTSLRENAEKYGYIYSSEPPYTVLQNDYISFNELRKLGVISDLVERFKNSGRFERSLAYVFDKVTSPFKFYEGLAEHIEAHDGRGIRKIGQADAYSLLFAFASTIPGVKTDELGDLLHEDFAEFEVRRAPKFKRQI